MKTMFASLMAFLHCVYIKNTISINIDMKTFLIFPSLPTQYQEIGTLGKILIKKTGPLIVTNLRL